MTAQLRDQYKGEFYFQNQLDNNNIRNNKLLNKLNDKDATEQSKQSTLKSLYKCNLKKH